MDSLKEYERKRDFQKTPEPPPGPLQSSTLRPGETGDFFVQRHNASHLHYDFRLAIGGTLKSWAVPKGPTLDPEEKRLAMEVEDHPLSYGEFEGNIPAGEYGGGSVMLWDRGTFELLGKDPAEKQMEKGDLKFQLKGVKLKGDFALIRMKGKRHKRNEWLLIKKRDVEAIPGWDAEVYATSISSGRSQDQIASQTAPKRASKSKPLLKAAKKAAPASSRKGGNTMPQNLSPMLATLSSDVPEGPGWAYEIKWDGVRALCFVSGGKPSIISRNGVSYDRQFPELHSLPEQLDAREAIVDGEIVAVDEKGVSHFQLLQPRIMQAHTEGQLEASGAAQILLYLFDVLWVDGRDLRSLPLQVRRKILEDIVKPGPSIRMSEQFFAEGGRFLETAQEHGIEGILAKRLDSPYRSSRSSAWLKVKTQLRQEFVICGWLPGKRSTFSALVLGLYEEGVLQWCGNVGTGFNEALLQSLFEELQARKARSKPAGTWPAGIRPVKPELVCEIKFAEWTRDGRLRAPVFMGLRPDKNAADCVKEEPMEAAVTKEKPAAAPKPKAVKKQKASVSPEPLLPGTANNVEVELKGKPLRFTNLNKLYFPEDKLTKRDLLNYYAAVGPFLLPYLKDRPLSLRRYPNGIHGEGFFQKNLPATTPDWVPTVTIYSEDSKRDINYALCPDLPTLLYLVNLGCIDHNPWMSRVASLDSPDYILLDLDPSGTTFAQVVEAALAIHEILEELKLTAFVKTSGGDGMHIVLPLAPGYTYDEARIFAEALAHVTASRNPGLITIERSLSERPKRRVYFDYVQIGKGKTIAAPYVVRPYSGAPVGTPLKWEELDRGLRPSDFHLRNILERLDKTGDLMAPLLKGKQKLEPVLVRLQAMLQE